MEILTNRSPQEVEAYVTKIAANLQKEWQIIEFTIQPASDAAISAARFAESLVSLFRYEEGQIYVFGTHKLVLVIHCGSENTPFMITRKIESDLPGTHFETNVGEAAVTGPLRLEVQMTWKKPVTSTLADIRSTRKENIILVADDDMYMRSLVKRGVERKATVQEITDGNDVITAYKKYIPDVLLLDIHLPGKNGTDVLYDVLLADPKAYVIMLSGDSSLDNVKRTVQQGAKGFMTKPFTKEKLLEYVSKCPTFN